MLRRGKISTLQEITYVSIFTLPTTDQYYDHITYTIHLIGSDPHEMTTLARVVVEQNNQTFIGNVKRRTDGLTEWAGTTPFDSDGDPVFAPQLNWSIVDTNVTHNWSNSTAGDLFVSKTNSSLWRKLFLPQ